MSHKSAITCHVLDASTGKPASGVQVRVQEHHRVQDGMSLFEPLAEGTTDTDGRCMNLLPASTGINTADGNNKFSLKPDTLYKVVFHTREYFERDGRRCFYPWVEITFNVGQTDEHYHIPLLISPYSYTTYRGS
ncbi:transthyretin [Punctularia strigosozonata HHB-11173 SS5]|uniref:transthyretin n=1 Tax=Punctularia strigosozonata (strain HHB-11173) TaxID=741275 RepID=UPI0004417F5F|nr:transthyretin [Punctularia strigosozonata HHB-11173 SS5]EIN13929.1 transthyretin [Punctularia strigosozonata HHB-11173 SS5]